MAAPRWMSVLPTAVLPLKTATETLQSNAGLGTVLGTELCAVLCTVLCAVLCWAHDWDTVLGTVLGSAVHKCCAQWLSATLASKEKRCVRCDCDYVRARVCGGGGGGVERGGGEYS